MSDRHSYGAIDASRVDDAVNALAPELIAFAQSLVRIPSVSGNEQAAQRAIAARYEALGLETDIVPSVREEVESHPAFSDDAIPFVDRLNVIGRWRGRGAGRSLIVNGHMDVVPPGDIAKWTRDPWGGEINGDRLYGRGACDMKSGLASAVFAVNALQSMGVELNGDVLLESVIGEESGGVGSLTTIIKGYRADACIIAEPNGPSSLARADGSAHVPPNGARARRTRLHEAAWCERDQRVLADRGCAGAAQHGQARAISRRVVRRSQQRGVAERGDGACGRLAVDRARYARCRRTVGRLPSRVNRRSEGGAGRRGERGCGDASLAGRSSANDRMGGRSVRDGIDAARRTDHRTTVV